MTVKCITPGEKQLLADWFQQDIFNQTELAEKFKTSKRTVNRVLVEAGIAPVPTSRVTDRMRAFMAIIDEYGLEPEGLAQALAAPALILENVQQFLNGCTPTQLAGLFYSSGIAKIIEQMHKQRADSQTAPKDSQEQPNFETSH
jgi:hypothetical protein